MLPTQTSRQVMRTRGISMSFPIPQGALQIVKIVHRFFVKRRRARKRIADGFYTVPKPSGSRLPVAMELQGERHLPAGGRGRSANRPGTYSATRLTDKLLTITI